MDAFNAANLTFILNGFWLTIRISALAIVFSIIFGTVLAMIKQYCRGKLSIFRWIVTAYIELFRCTPNLLWILICYVYAPLPTAFLRSSFAFVLFTSAAIAEIVRGGLNSIAKGQFEAAYSQGFSFVQTLWLIVLPQCFQRIVPTLVSQVITVIKDTSFLSMVAVAELMFRSRNALSLLPRYTGQTVGIAQVGVVFGFAAIVYFVVNFALSCLVRWLQKRRLRVKA